MCGMRKVLGSAVNRGSTLGSLLYASMPAARSFPDLRAATSASSSTRAPRAALTKMAPSGSSANPRCVHQAASGWGDVTVEAEEVAVGKHVLERLVVHALARAWDGPDIVIVNPHVEAACSTRHDAPDPAHAEDAKSLAGDLRAHHECGTPVFPQSLAHQLFPFTRAASGTDHQHHRELGGRVRQHVWSVGYDDASCACGFQVDMVVADREVGDNPDLGGQTLENVGGEMLRVAGKDGLRAVGALDELVAGVEAVVWIQARLVVAL